MLISAWDSSPCFDEPEHITAGYCNLVNGQLLMNPFHPPLVKEVAGAVVQWVYHPPLPAHWESRPQQAVLEMFSGQSFPVQELLRWARLPNFLLAGLFPGVYFLLLAGRWSTRPALLASLMLVGMPTYLAHGPLVHTDVPVTVATFGALWLTLRYWEQPHPHQLTKLVLTCILGLLVKHSFVLPFVLATVTISVRHRRSKKFWLGPLFGVICLTAVTALYALQPVPPDYQEMYQQTLFRRRVGRPVPTLIQEMGRLPGIRHLAWYATGLAGQARHVSQGHLLTYTYFLGQRYRGQGNRLFFPLILWCKLPVASLLVCLLGGWGLCKNGRKSPPEVVLFLGFSLFYLTLAMLANLNLGLRHLLPALPPLFAALAYGAQAALPQKRAQRGLLVLLAAGLTWSLTSTAPFFLSYYNGFAGGQPVALDSDYDWGTDLWRLKQRAQAQGWQALPVSYYGRVPLTAYWGDEARILDASHLPQDGLAAMSANNYYLLKTWENSREPETTPPLAIWLKDWEIKEQIGSMLVLQRGAGGSRRN